MGPLSGYLLICIVALLGSGLTLFSGFGLGTILLPVFGIFFPLEIAIALTAIVHFLNNIFKLILLGKHADRNVIIRFGIPSIIAAFVGAYALSLISGLEPIYQYSISDKTFSIMPLKLVIAVLLGFFALFDIIPKLTKLQFAPKYLSVGGVLSGFFGGLSGMQGALRSAFLVRAGLSKEAFIASGVVIACMIDVARLSVYSQDIIKAGTEMNYGLLAAATLSAFAGAFIGSKLMKKVTIVVLQYFVAVMLLLFSILLGAGIV